jgi:hypothetical protein
VQFKARNRGDQGITLNAADSAQIIQALNLQDGQEISMDSDESNGHRAQGFTLKVNRGIVILELR